MRWSERRTYSVEYSELQYMTIKSGQDMVTVRCRITLLGDDGLPVLFKEGYGASEFTYANKSNKDGNITNEPHNATTSAFKNAAKWFGIFGFYDVSSGKSKPASSKSAEKTAEMSSEKSGKKADVKINVHTKDAFFSGGVENRTKKEIWKVKATLDSDNTACELIYYPNQYGKDEKTFNSLMELSGKKSVSLRILASDCGDRNGFRQFIFKEYILAA